jgi:glycosyltransferase involved in cell wall biosynthesis
VTTGGVYTWEKILIESLSDTEFTVLNVLSNSGANGNYKLPKNVVRVIELPLFGSNRLEEFVKDGRKSYLAKILRTSSRTIRNEFIPIFEEFLTSVSSSSCEPSEISDSVVKLHAFFTNHDSKKCLEDPVVFETFLDVLRKDPLYSEMRLGEALPVFQLFQRSMQILSIDVPEVDIVHCALAWMPALVAMVAKARTGCPVIVTEHGLAFKELLLYYSADQQTNASKLLLKVVSSNIIKTIYWTADIVAPVCEANAEWERRLGVERPKISVIYNGINAQRFRPTGVHGSNVRPTLVSVGRIDVFKDIVMLLTAIGYVSKEVPDILCLIYGTSIDLEYSLECLETVNALGLQDNVRFMGGTKEPELAYNSGDVVVVSSITEGFPYAVIEAMACGKPVVATDVGGVREALEGCGILVRSRNPHELAKGILTLLRDEQLRNDLGLAARERVIQRFTISQSVDQYRQMYDRLFAARERREETRPKEEVQPVAAR